MCDEPAHGKANGGGHRREIIECDMNANIDFILYYSIVKIYILYIFLVIKILGNGKGLILFCFFYLLGEVRRIFYLEKKLIV